MDSCFRIYFHMYLHVHKCIWKFTSFVFLNDWTKFMVINLTFYQDHHHNQHMEVTGRKCGIPFLKLWWSILKLYSNSILNALFRNFTCVKATWVECPIESIIVYVVSILRFHPSDPTSSPNNGSNTRVPFLLK